MRRYRNLLDAFWAKVEWTLALLAAKGLLVWRTN